MNWRGWIPLLLAVAAFLVYWPSLSSDFVYDAREEILAEGFVTSPAHLPDVLSLQVLSMNIMLGNRPGQLLYLMSIAVLCGKDPFGYHLASNLLHAANVALVFIVLSRLIAEQYVERNARARWKVRLAAAAGTALFAVHPLAVETVSNISYSSDLLVVFFTLLALLAAIAFRAEKFSRAILAGSAGTLCAFAAVACKESGMAVPLVLFFYWLLFRRHEPKAPWLCFLGAATVVTATFMAARIILAPPSQEPVHYLGGSFFQVFLIQPRLWVFMIGQLFWPAHLSADYTMENVAGISTPVAAAALLVVVLLQAWLATRSRLGALGVGIYWLGLVTVSNFIPLNRILGDRFYYLPMVGAAIQLTSLLLLTLKWQRGFWPALLPCLAALVPLTVLTVEREAIFANEVAFWTATEQASPFSTRAHCGLGTLLLQSGQLDAAIAQFQAALDIDPGYGLAHMNVGVALFQKGRLDDATVQFQKAVELDPTSASAHNDLGVAFLQKGRLDEATAEFQQALQLQPGFGNALDNLAKALAMARQKAGGK